MALFLAFGALIGVAQPAAAQFTQLGSKVVGSGATNAAQQGAAVAVSGSGQILIEGGNYDNSNTGAAWVFLRSGSTWRNVGGKLVGSGGVGTQNQGYSVGIDTEGDTVIVGGYYDNSFTGAAWIFTLGNNTYTQVGSKLVGTGASGPAFQGDAVAMSGDGNTAIVGGFGDNSSVGAAWIFTQSNGTWSQQGSKLTASDETGAGQFASAVALSSDGNTALIGGNHDGSGGSDAGAAWVFTRSGSTWSEQAKLVGSGASANAYAGQSVALSADGNTAVVGSATGVWVFTRSGSTWTQVGSELIGTGTTGAQVPGASVGVNANGTTLIAGSPGDNTNVGATWVFKLIGGTWTQQGSKLLGSDVSGAAEQGYAVSLSNDGDTAIVGGPADNTDVGAVWIYVQLPTISSISPTSGPASGGTSVTITGTNLTDPSGVTFGNKSAASFTGNSNTSITATSPAGAIGTVDVRVATSGGASATSAADQFTYKSAVNTHDFNGDGYSDIAWRGPTGDLAIWLMNGTQILSGPDLGNVPTNWTIVGQRQFNNSAYADLLWRGPTGDLQIWFMNGTQILSTADFGTIPTNWSIVGTSAYNASNGYAELFWRSTAGDVAIWQINGSQILAGPDIGNVPTSWTIAGTGDFSGTGNIDILWRGPTGDVAIWFMNGTQVVSAPDFINVPTSWTIVGTGDFNGDGKTDILWRSSTGDVSIWLMNGTQILSGPDLGNVPTSWTIAETGDFNGDGYTDILWRGPTGDVAIWFMNGTQILSGPDFINVPTSWTIQGANAD